MKDYVSVIIPSYNYGHLISETLLSVINQSYTLWECLVVDDGSTDNTERIVRKIMQEHAELKIRYIKIKNSGTSNAKNIGLSEAKGEFIQFLDADDLIEKDKLKNHVSVLLSGNHDFVYSDSVFFSIQNSSMTVLDKFPLGYLLKQSICGSKLVEALIVNNRFTISAPLFRSALLFRHALTRFDCELNHNEDWLFWLDLALKDTCFIYNVSHHSRSLIRVHPNSAMQDKKRMFLGEEMLRKKVNLKLLNWPVAGGRLTIGLLNLNSDLLALHQVRSLRYWDGFQYLLSIFLERPKDSSILFLKALLRLAKRGYRSLQKY